jgi:hypothetical protein
MVLEGLAVLVDLGQSPQQGPSRLVQPSSKLRPLKVVQAAYYG